MRVSKLIGTFAVVSLALVGCGGESTPEETDPTTSSDPGSSPSESSSASEEEPAAASLNEKSPRPPTSNAMPIW